MKEPNPSRRLFAISLLSILLVAAALRLYRLPTLPVGLHYDEAANGILSAGIAQGDRPVFISAYTGKEVLFFYWTALWIKLLGASVFTLRLSASLAGLATVAAAGWAAHELFHGRQEARRVALLGAAFIATSFWHLVLSRYGFRAVMQPLMQALTVAALWRGLRGKSSVPWLLLGGLCCGLTAHTYLAARAFPIPLAAALIVLVMADRGHRRARLGQLALFLLAAAVVLAPLAHYWLTHPGSFLNRTQQVAAINWNEIWAGLRACLGMFFLRGDPYIRFNLPWRPLFDPLTAAFFLIGIAALLWRRKETADPLHLAAHVLLLASLPVMLLPSALATGEITPSNLRTVGQLPFIYILPALGLVTLECCIVRRLPFHVKRQTALYARSAVFALLVASLALTTGMAYFRDWAPSAALYTAADGDLADLAAYLNQSDLTATVPYVASIHYRHPTLAFLAEAYEEIRWLTGGETIVLPAAGEALLAFPRSASQELAWVQSLLSEDALVAAPPGPDGAPAFTIYRVASDLAIAPTHPLSANLGHAALLLGYDVIDQPRSGQNVEVAVWWRVLNRPAAGDYGPLARLDDPWGLNWGETQPFHYPAEQWTAGERVVDHLSIPVSPGAPPGDYLLHFSLYAPSANSLLPLLDEADRYAGTRVELPVWLERAAQPPHPDDLDIRTRLNASADGLALLGVNLDTASARPGERLFLTLFWQARSAPLPDLGITLTLGETLLAQGAPVHDTYSTSAWTAGEVVADRYGPRLPRLTEPGEYRLHLQAGDLSLDLGSIAVQALDRSFAVPPISRPLTIALGEQVELLGYNLSAERIAPGETLTLTLYWRALAEMDERYTVFTHLLAPDGSIVGQQDNPPLGGAYPTDLWLAGEVVADPYAIPVHTDAPPGVAALEVGMYLDETGARLPVGGGDAVHLCNITLSE